MALRRNPLESRLGELDRLVALLRGSGRSELVGNIERWRLDLAAARFHLADLAKRPMLVVILGGTGTGKSTLINRLLDSNVTASSFRRTFTAGAVAVVSEPSNIPQDWLAIDLLVARELPVRGQPEALTVVTIYHELVQRVSLIDTPDLDGDQPAHHAQADRAFRWADAILFLVTPEKYQMTELLPYYRLASRYELPAVYVMNKVESQEVVEDYASQLPRHTQARDAAQEMAVYAIARDDAAYEPPPQMGLAALRERLRSMQPPPREVRRRGACARLADQLDRLRDQIIAPMGDDRRTIDSIVQSLRALESPQPGVDVNPLTQQLQRRLQQRSVLYLMGPTRMLERVRQVPGLLARLPRTVWDLYRHGELRRGADDLPTDVSREVPDFQAALVDQFAIVQSRIDDVIRGSPLGQRLLAEQQQTHAAALIPATEAGAIAEQELAELKAWLDNRWNATPRDTALMRKLLRLLPGGEKLTRWSEAAPYLLTIVVAAHGALFGPIDLIVIGGFSLATWLGEKLSNEVASRARLTNQRIALRFTQLAHDQVERMCVWLDQRAASAKQLDELTRIANDVSEAVAECQAE